MEATTSAGAVVSEGPGTIIWLNLGVVHDARRQPELSEKAYRRVLEVLDPSTRTKRGGNAKLPVEHQQTRASALNNLGNLQFRARRWIESEDNLRAALAIREELLDRFPSVPRYRYGLSGCYNNLGNLLSDRDRPDDAQAAYENAVRLHGRLAGDFPDSPEYAVALAGASSNLGKLIGDRGQLEESLPRLNKAVTIVEPFHGKDRRDAKVRETLSAALQTRATTLCGLQRSRESLPDWDRAIQLEDGRERDAQRIKRASALLNLQNYARATADALAVAQSPAASGPDLFHAACAFAIVAQSVPEQKVRAELNAASAVAVLRQAIVKGGLARAGSLASYGDPSALRDREDFKTLMRDEEGIYRDAVRTSPNDAVARYSLGRLLRRRGRLPESIESLRKAVELRPDYAEVHELLGYVYGIQGDFAAAETAYRSAVEYYTDKEDTFRAYLNLGGVLARRQRQPQAAGATGRVDRRLPSRDQMQRELR